MSTFVRRTVLALLALFAVSLAGSTAAHADDVGLDAAWEVEGPVEPQWLAADDEGAVALGRRGEMVAVDASGNVRWRISIANGRAFGSVAMRADLVVVALDRGFVALTRATGDIQWEHLAEDPRIASIGTTSDGTTLVALLTDNGALDVVDGETGTTRWTIRVAIDERMLAARAWVLGERVVHTWSDRAGSHLRAYLAAGGLPLWEHDAPGFSSMPVVDEDTVSFAENIRLDERREIVFGAFRKLAVSDGRELWSRPMRTRSGFWAGVPTAAGPQGLAFVDIAGRVTVVDTTTGRSQWRWKTERRQLEAEAHVVGDVFAMTTYGTGVVAAAMTDGEPLSIDGIEEGQTSMTIQASAAVRARLYLLVSWPWGDAEIWMLQAHTA